MFDELRQKQSARAAKPAVDIDGDQAIKREKEKLERERMDQNSQPNPSNMIGVKEALAVGLANVRRAATGGDDWDSDPAGMT